MVRRATPTLPWVRLLLVAVAVGAGVAFTYFAFEGVVHRSIALVWDEWLHTDMLRWLVVPLTLALTLLYFGVQHALDAGHEHTEAHGLGEAPKPTVWHFFRVLIIGFLSLLAGAALGPEAILVPASVILGSLIGVRLLRRQKELTKYAAALGFIALLAAFFNSFITGVLGLLLVKRQFELPLRPWFIAASALTSLVVVGVLSLLESDSYVAAGASWVPSFASLVWLLAIATFGWALPYLFKSVYVALDAGLGKLRGAHWALRGLVAGAGLAALYLLGGTLVQFTGNESIQPMLTQAATLGLAGLLVIMVVKIIAIAWSKAAGYRGGLIFPMVFVLSTGIALAQLYTDALPFTLALVVGAAAMLIGDRRAKVLL